MFDADEKIKTKNETTVIAPNDNNGSSRILKPPTEFQDSD